MLGLAVRGHHSSLKYNDVYVGVAPLIAPPRDTLNSLTLVWNVDLNLT